MKERKRVTRKEAREQLVQLNLACELAKLIRHFFPDLIPLLREIPDPRHQSYITYPSTVLLMTRILSSIFYISSMRKTSEEFNSDKIIENIRVLCGMDTTDASFPTGKQLIVTLKMWIPKNCRISCAGSAAA